MCDTNRLGTNRYGTRNMDNKNELLSELVETIIGSFRPDTCECHVRSDISLDITLTSYANPTRQITMTGVYIPSLLTARAIANLVLEGRYLLSLSAEATASISRQEM